MSLVIEFAGLPGAGKSTARAWAVRQLGDWETVTLPPPTGLAGRISWLVRKGLVVAASIRVVVLGLCGVALGCRSVRHKVFAVRALVAVLHAHEVGRRSTRPLVLDEGVVQRAFMLFVDTEKGADVDRARRYVKAAPLPDVLVYLRVGADVATARQLARLTDPSLPTVGLPSRLLTLEAGKLRYTLKEGERLLEAVTDSIRSHCPEVSVVEIDAATHDVVDQQLAARLGPYLQQATGDQPR